MNIKNMFWAALMVTASLVVVSCGNDSEIAETKTPVAPQTTKQIPYTISVSYVESTRATVDGDNYTLRFAAGDKLYITGENIKGVLSFNPESNYVGETFVDAENTFSSTLEYSGVGDPAPSLALTATLVSAQQTADNEVNVDAAGAVTVNYPTTACATMNEAVQKYSLLTASFPFDEYNQTGGTDNLVNRTHRIMLTQQTAFLNFAITFEDGTASGSAITAKVKNGVVDYTANVTTVAENAKVVGKFVLPVADGTTLNNAILRVSGKATFAITDATLAGNKVYSVNRTALNIASIYTAVPFTIEATSAGNIKISNPRVGMQYSKNGGAKMAISTSDNVTISVSAGDKVQFYGNGTTITKYYEGSSNMTKIGGSAECKVYGNVMSLVDETGFATNTTLPGSYTFAYLFQNNTKLTDASNLILPAMTLTDHCYMYMFQGCTNLTAGPELPASVLVTGCYQSMFRGTSLKTITCLATNLGNGANYWVQDIKTTFGTFIKAEGMTSWPTGDSGIPSGWNVIDY